MAFWNPWRGCHKYSSGCMHCYIHKGDAKRGVNTNEIIKSDKFYAPILKDKKGLYTIKPGSLVYTCFSSDFLLEDADQWRTECWKMIKERSDLKFLFLTKRIERLAICLPEDWGNGYDNVIIGCTIEDQEAADIRLPIFRSLPIKHRNIICQPMISAIDLEKYLKNVELVVVGGESDSNGRLLDYDWVLNIREQCQRQKVHFEFRQCGTFFKKDGKIYKLQTKNLMSMARKANIDF